MKRAISIALALVGCGCAPLSAGKQYFAQAMPVCNLISDEDKYAGQAVLVSGLYESGPAGGYIYGRGCSGQFSLRGSLDAPTDTGVDRVIEAAFIRNEFARVPVVVRGVFQPVERRESGERVLHFNCPCIEGAAFVAARQP